MTIVHAPHFLHVPRSAAPDWLPLDTQEPLLACLSLVLLALACYLAWPGIARCYRQMRLGASWFVRTMPAGLDRTLKIRRVTLQSAPDRPRTLLSWLARQCKLGARSMLYPRQTRRWLAFWNLSATHSALALATPRLLHKIYRPYQSLRLRPAERMAILMSHYDFVIRRGLAPLVLQAASRPIPVGQFSGKAGDLYEVRLAAIASLDHEGELALHLYRDNRLLFSTAFTICRQPGGWVIRIGCLQGPGCADSREQIRRATRDMFGLRPKALMIRLVRAIGAGIGCGRVVLVGNGNRVANRHSKRKRVHADYDAFWQEIGAARRSDGDYELPCVEPETRLDQLPSRKRAEARQRLAFTRQATWEVGRLFSCASR